MNGRTLARLVVALVVLGAAAWWTRRERPASVRPAAESSGLLLGELDANGIAALELVGRAGTTTVARREGRWVVAGLWNYPADFETVAGEIRKLVAAEAGPVVRGGEDHLEEFGLGGVSTNALDEEMKRVRLLDAAGRPLAVLDIGKPYTREGDPGAAAVGRYVRANEGAVEIVDELNALPWDDGAWIDRSLASVPVDEVRSVEVCVSNQAVRLEVGSPEDFSIAERGEDEEIVADQARHLAGALQNLSFVTVADPARQPADTGLDHPAVFRLRTKGDLVYTVEVGKRGDAEHGTFARVALAFQNTASTNVPEIEALAKRALDFNARHGSWVYVLSPADADTLTMARGRLVRTKEPSPAPASAVTTSAPSETVAAPPAAPAAAPPDKEKPKSRKWWGKRAE